MRSGEDDARVTIVDWRRTMANRRRDATPTARVVVHLGRPQQPLALWTIEFLDSFIPAATVLKLNIQVFGVEPKHRYRG